MVRNIKFYFHITAKFHNTIVFDSRFNQYKFVFIYSAPGQETFLWNETRKRLDKKLLQNFPQSGQTSSTDFIDETTAHT